MEKNRYNNSKVYKLIDTVNQYFYIGSTCLPLSKRLYDHKQTAKRDTERKVYKYFNQIGWDNVKIILHHELYLDNKEELLRAENDVIMAYIDDPKCLNSIRSLLNDDQRKEYVKDHNKEYRENNKEKLKEMFKQYYEAKIEKALEKYTCSCGAIIANCSKLRHERTKFHQSWLHDQTQTAETI